MRTIYIRAKEFLSSESGPVAVEYGVLLAIIVTMGLASFLIYSDLLLAMYMTIMASVGSG